MKQNECKNIKVFIMDVDGTLTDGKIYMGKDGEMMKAFNIKDGCGIHDILIPMGILPVIITGRTSAILENRCQELGIKDLYQGAKDKLRVMRSVIEKKGISYNNVAYIGDDINDLECMNEVQKNGGVVGCPKDAVNEVKKIADYVSLCNGGEGAVREFIEWIIAKS